MKNDKHIKSARRPWSLSRALVLCLLTLILGAGSTLAADAVMKDVSLETEEGNFYVSALLSGAFTSEIKETLASGAPVTFTYILQLKRKRRAIWDKTEMKLAIKRMAMFDALTKEYLTWWKSAEDEDDIGFKDEIEKAQVKRGKERAEDRATGDGKKVAPLLDPLIIKKSQELEQWMTKLNRIEIGPIDGLKNGAVYYARTRAEIKSLKLIPPFNYILFFLSFWDFDTDWSESESISLEVEANGLERKEATSLNTKKN